MKLFLTITVIFGSFTLSHAQGYYVNLDGSQEVPPNDTAGNPLVSGYADFTLTGSTLSTSDGDFSILGFPGTITVNDGAAGSNGPVLFDLQIGVEANPLPYSEAGFSGSGILTAQEINDLNAGDLYVNIPGTSFPDGEIRGQIVPEPATWALIGTSALGLFGLRRQHPAGG